MRKYRYGDPTKAGFFTKYGNFLYFFAAWNLMGFIAWKTMNANQGSKDENWGKKSFSKFAGFVLSASAIRINKTGPLQDFLEKKKELTDEFELKTCEKYLSLIGYGTENKQATHVKIHGLYVESSPEEKTS